MNRPVINAVGHVAIAVTDLDAAIDNATTLLGLRVSERRDDGVDLTHGAPHHSLQYVAGEANALDHIGLVAADAAALDEIHSRAGAAGVRVARESPFDPSLSEGFVLEGPEGFLFEIYRGMPHGEPEYAPVGVRPNRFGHVTIHLGDTVGMRDFLEGVLDFRISDAVGDVFFLRCNVDHHGIGVVPGAARLHHYGYEVQSTMELAQLADRIDEAGGAVLVGPVRHGAGNNIALYYSEPSGAVVEYYCDMLRIYDDEAYEPVRWDPEGHKWFSRWDPRLPEGILELGVPVGGSILQR
jgi:catechol 2,3-dioxygenase